jgi:hypothetical protein
MAVVVDAVVHPRMVVAAGVAVHPRMVVVVGANLLNLNRRNL